MYLLNFLLLGFIIGLLISLLDKRREGGILGPALLGLTGSLIGIIISSVLTSFSGSIPTILTSIFSVASVLALFSFSRFFKPEK